MCFSWRKTCTELERNLLVETQDWFPYVARAQVVTGDSTVTSTAKIRYRANGKR